MKSNTSALSLSMELLLVAMTTGFAQPTITVQPQSQTNFVGSSLALFVEAMGVPPLAYQWNRNSFPLTEATNAALVFTNFQISQMGNYTLVVSNVEGSVTSAVAFVRVLVRPAISIQPTNQVTETGAAVTFTGTAPLAYQWRLNNLILAGKTNPNLALTNVQLTDAGDYSVVVSNAGGMATSQVASLVVLPSDFARITTGHIVNDGAHSVGCAWGDYDNDDLLDLFVTNADGQNNFLYRNNGDGSFTRITSGSIVNEAGDWRGCAWADYDNDGRLDLFVTSTDSKNMLYRNNGDGTFTTMTTNNVGRIVTGGGVSEGCVWGDYDNDGWLDMFVARYGNDYLFHALGDGTFDEVTTGSLVQDNRDNYSAAWADYDNDGRLDLFVASISSRTNLLYRNLGSGSFEKVAAGPVTTGSGYFSGCSWGDYDNDGNLDLFVAGGLDSQSQTNLLYRNNGDGTFTRITDGSIATDVGNFGQGAWGDYDNDGYLDLFVSARLGQKNVLYRNNGDATFTRITTGRVVNDSGESVGCAWGDYDNDGFLDLFVANGAHQSQNNYLYHNNGNTNHWIKIKCVGTVSNRSAFGANVKVKATIRGTAVWQLRQINSGCGFGSGDPIAHFGLGQATVVDTLRIEWPSGAVQEFQNVAVNQFLTVTEPPRLQPLSRLPGGSFQLSLIGGVGLRYDLEVSTNLANWTLWTTRTNTSRTMTLIDTTATNVAWRFYRAVSR